MAPSRRTRSSWARQTSVAAFSTLDERRSGFTAVTVVICCCCLAREWFDVWTRLTITEKGGGG